MFSNTMLKKRFVDRTQAFIYFFLLSHNELAVMFVFSPNIGDFKQRAVV